MPAIVERIKISAAQRDLLRAMGTKGIVTREGNKAFITGPNGTVRSNSKPVKNGVVDSCVKQGFLSQRGNSLTLTEQGRAARRQRTKAA